MQEQLLNTGRNALVNALITNTPINITKLHISAIPNITLDPAATDVVGGIVYSSSSGNIFADVINSNELRILVKLDQTIGSFLIGNVVLFLDDGTPFMSGSITTAVQKLVQNLPSEVGNIVTLNMTLTYTNVTTAVNVTILNPLYATLPFITDTNALPIAGFAAYDVYNVQNDVRSGRPVIVFRRASDNTWWSSPIVDPYDSADFGLVVLDGGVLQDNMLTAPTRIVGGALYSPPLITRNIDFGQYTGPAPTTNRDFGTY